MSYSGYATGYAPAAGTEAVSVTNTWTASWNVIARATNTWAASWSTAAAPGVATVQASWSASWNVANALTSTTSVTASWSAAWDVRQSAAAFFSASWTVFSQQSANVVPTHTPGARLRVFAPNGADLGPLPTPESISAAYPLNDVGGLTFSYAARAARSSLLGQPCEVAIQVSPDGGITWTEPDNSRFVYTSDSRDPLNTADRYAVECKSYVWRLSKARVLPNGLLNADGKRAFLSASPGVILKTLLNEAQARGALTGITHATFSPGADSAGRAWAKILTVYYEPGLDYLAILQNLADQGFIDFRMQGRDLRVFNADTVMARDLTVGSGQVTLRAGRDFTEAPFRRTWEGLADYAYFAGADGAKYETTNAAAITPWGRQETYISNGSVSDQGTMATLTQAELAQSDRERIEYTRGLDFTQAVARPFWDYIVGDYIWAAVSGAAPERLRIFQLTLTVDANGTLSGNTVLNDRFIEADIRQKRRIEGITNGASSGDGTGGGAPPPGTDKVAPAKVVGLTASSDAYLGPGGFTQAQVTLTWAAPTTNSDGTVITDLDRYEVFQRQIVTGGVVPLRQVGTTTDTIHSMSPYQSGSTWAFAVRAVDHDGNRGAMSAEVLVGMARDATPPQTPTAPTVTSRLGTLVVTWDGLPVTGVWPADFSHVEVHQSQVNNFTPSNATLFDRLFTKGATTVIADLAFGVPVYVRLVAVDTSALKSAPSVQGVGTPARLVGTDIDPGAITYEQIGFKDPGNLILDGSFESQPFRDRMTALSSGWQFTTATAYHGNFSATADGSVNPGTFRILSLMDRNVDVQQIMAGEKLFCRYAYNVTSGASGTLQFAVQWIDPDNVTLSYSLLNATVKNGAWQQAAQQMTAPAGVASFRIYLQLRDDVTFGVHAVDAIEVRRTVGTAIIQDAAIGNAQIANLAVNDAKIATVQVGKLTAGTMTADVLLAGRFKTSTSGSRIEFDASGIRMYNSTTLTGNWLTSRGQLRIYSSTDATHTSTGHGLQFGDDNSSNLIIDENEVMSRDNGGYSDLLLNREGGAVLIGGQRGGFTESQFGQIPDGEEHVIQLRGAVQVWNRTDGDYADFYPPLTVGVRSEQHLWFDNNEFGSSTGAGVGTLSIQPEAAGGNHHATPLVLSSSSIGVRRGGNYSAGDRMGFIYSFDPAGDVGLRFEGSTLTVKSGANTGTREIVASAFTVASQRKGKKEVVDFDPFPAIRKAKSQRWQYVDTIEPGQRIHYGPMLEDLPPDLHHDLGRAGEDAGSESLQGYDVVALVGTLWEAVRLIIDRIETLEKVKPK